MMLQLLTLLFQLATKETLLSFIGFFKQLGSKAHELLLKVFGQSALDNVESQLKQLFEEDVLVIFKDAIVGVSTLNGSGADKRQAAFNQIATDLKAKGLSFKDSAINLGIEMVVNLLKSKVPA